MSRQKKVTVVKTAQRADTLKLVMLGKVVGSVAVINTKTAELRDHREILIGTFSDAATAIAEFEKTISLEEIRLDL